MSDIEKIELVLASPFWRDDSTMCSVGPMTLSIVNLADGYHWKMWDKDDSSIQSSKQPSPSFADAKSSMRKVVEGMRDILQERPAQ